MEVLWMIVIVLACGAPGGFVNVLIGDSGPGLRAFRERDQIPVGTPERRGHKGARSRDPAHRRHRFGADARGVHC